MASETIPLWSGPLHKEALDLMTSLWPSLCEEARERLVGKIIAGPPLQNEIENAEAPERVQRYRDRRIFVRLMLLERLRDPPLPTVGISKLVDLKLAYPNWTVEPGDRAHFTMWMESSHNLESDRSVEDLESLAVAELREALRMPGDDREGRLEVWSHVVRKSPGQGIDLLEALAEDVGEDDAVIWRDTLTGLREAVTQPEMARRVVDVLTRTPDHILISSRMLMPASDILESAAKQEMLPFSDAAFWRLWDRLFDGCLVEGPEDDPEKDKWIERAINRPIGRLTTALLDLMFRRGLKAGEGFPADFQDRLEKLVEAQPVQLRLARVILASRLVYLFAVDPAWAAAVLIPYSDWRQSEDEAIAFWLGYCWNGRINADLWSAFVDFFFDAFTPARIARLGSSSDTLASLLMVVGVELPAELVSSDRARTAIRAMTEGNREAAVSWLYRYLAGPHVEGQSADAAVEQASRADRLWIERVLPWLRRAWPRDADLVTPGMAEQFALVAVATDRSFPTAVDTLATYMTLSERWDFVVSSLLQSTHPENWPEATLKLLGKIVAIQGRLFTDKLRDLLARVIQGRPDLRQNVTYRTLDARLRAAGR